MLILLGALVCVALGSAGGLLYAHRVLRPVWESKVRMFTPLEADELFAQAEYMAKHRKSIAAGRERQPRDDAGPPARISRVKPRFRRPQL